MRAAPTSSSTATTTTTSGSRPRTPTATRIARVASASSSWAPAAPNCAPFEEPARTASSAAAVAHGVLKLDLRAGSYDWTFIPTAGDFADAGSGPCH